MITISCRGNPGTNHCIERFNAHPIFLSVSSLPNHIDQKFLHFSLEVTGPAGSVGGLLESVAGGCRSSPFHLYFQKYRTGKKAREDKTIKAAQRTTTKMVALSSCAMVGDRLEVIIFLNSVARIVSSSWIR